MKIYTAYDEEIIDTDKFNEYYAEFELDPKSFFNSLIKIRSKLIKNTIRTFTEDNERPITTLDYMIREEELHYDASLNAIFISAGGLGEILFSSYRPDYLNYATLGSILGHEIAYGFILTGPNYDENGVKKNWWKKEAALEQERRAQCFANRYEKYQGETNADHVTNEILPDNAGVMIAYNAYLTRPKTDFEDHNLPSFNEEYSKTQMFWIAYADMMCTKRKRSRRIQSHPHPSVRINGVVENSEQFSRDFECRHENKMNPAQKCTVW